MSRRQFLRGGPGPAHGRREIVHLADAALGRAEAEAIMGGPAASLVRALDRLPARPAIVPWPAEVARDLWFAWDETLESGGDLATLPRLVQKADDRAECLGRDLLLNAPRGAL